MASKTLLREGDAFDRIVERWLAWSTTWSTDGSIRQRCFDNFYKEVLSLDPKLSTVSLDQILEMLAECEPLHPVRSKITTRRDRSNVGMAVDEQIDRILAP